jgi:crotonobetainyl-CoA:carnitine CoA-transferase CaiB-like acyl-CoA transferase
MTTLPLSDVTILDFTRVLAGPFCTMLLGDLGADVIKVESHEGDDTRQWGPPFTPGGMSAYFICANRSKRSITLNLKSPDGQQIARKLASQAQIVVENFKVGGMASFGLDYESLRQDNPALVYGSITGYGQTGLYADRPGYDFVTQAESGLMAITGEPEGAPMKVGVAISDVMAGLFAALSLLGALRHAERTGVGQQVDIALLDTTLAALVNVASAALVSGNAPRRYGNGHPTIVPYQSFPASDRRFVVAVGNDRQFRALCGIIGRPEWADDPRFATNPARVRHRDTLIPLLGAAFASRTASEWTAALLAAGIPSGEVKTLPQILHDPHIRSRGLIRSVEVGDFLLRMIGHPVVYSETPAALRLLPPALGQHTDEVLRGRLGLDAAALADLRARGVI